VNKVSRIIKILGTNNSQFEYNMAFIPVYNRSSLDDRIRYCNIILDRCCQYDNDGTITRLYLNKVVEVIIEKIKLDHCE